MSDTIVLHPIGRVVHRGDESSGIVEDLDALDGSPVIDLKSG